MVSLGEQWRGWSYYKVIMELLQYYKLLLLLLPGEKDPGSGSDAAAPGHPCCLHPCPWAQPQKHTPSASCLAPHA